MSNDQAPGAPSFGDLFDDPDAPLLPVDPAPLGGAAVAEAAAAAAQPQETGDPVEDDAPQPEAEAEDSERPAVAAAETDDDAPSDVEPDEAADARPEAAAHAVIAGAAAGAASAQPVTAQPVSAQAAWDGTVDPAAASAPAGRVDTGRLYRSAGAEGPATLDAIPAIDPSYVPRRPTSVSPAASSVVPEPTRGGGRGLTYSGVAVVVISVTVLVAFADALINDKLGILTGLALAVSSIYAAVAVRRADIWAAVVMPPIAFLVAALTAGQLTLDSSGSLVIREAYMLFRSLAVNAPWILGTTVVCLVIVLVRRARS